MADNAINTSAEGAKEDTRGKRGGRGRDRREETPREKSPYIERVVFINRDVNAVGLSASDGNLIRAKKFEPIIDGKRADLGFVGEVESCNPAILESLITEGYLPVVSPIAADESGIGYNVNADQVAAAIAGAMKADSMLFLTDVDGIYRDFSDKTSLLSKTNLRELSSLKIADGMIPKVAAISAAIKAGAQSVRVCNGTKIDAVLDAFAGEGGTLVTA